MCEWVDACGSWFGSRTRYPHRCCNRAKFGHNSIKSLHVGHVEGGLALFREWSAIRYLRLHMSFINVRMYMLWSKSWNAQRPDPHAASVIVTWHARFGFAPYSSNTCTTARRGGVEITILSELMRRRLLSSCPYSAAWSRGVIPPL